MKRLPSSICLPCMALLAACGGGGGGGGGGGNAAPTANAGADQSVTEQSQVALSGSGQDTDGTIQSYVWSQLSGPTVTLTGGSTASASFDAPSLSAVADLSFRLTVTDDAGGTGTDIVVITVNPDPALNTAPVAAAGADQNVAIGTLVQLTGSGSSDTDGSIASYAWVQDSGPAVTLANADTSVASFTSPAVTGSVTLVFTLTVTDNEGAQSSDTASVVVFEDLGDVIVSGTVTFDYVPVGTCGGGFRCLDYDNTEERPARGVIVRVEAVGGGTLTPPVVTDDAGMYSVMVPAAVDAQVFVRAEMLNSAPSWDVSVVDNTAGDALYVLDGGQFNTQNGVVIDVHAPSGWDGNDYGTRSAAPFAILDVAYAAMQVVRSVDPDVDFPELVMHWSPNNTPGDETDINAGTLSSTFYSSSATGHPHPGIYMLGAEDEDTEEYDRHVIAHEWGHYFESIFSRSNSIGGPHGGGDQLDMRVAFGEGFGNAWAAIVNDDPVYVDTVGSGQAFGFGFSVETSSNSARGWYSEASIQEIIYDLYDPTGEDAIELGLGPIYEVLVGPHRSSAALTSIFLFAHELKEANPGMAAAIDAVLATQQIEPVVDEYGTGENNAGTSPSDPANVLPIYEQVTVNGASVNVCSTDNFSSAQTGSVNKLGSRRYIRFSVPASGSHSFSMRTTEAPAGETTDPDMDLYWNGLRLFTSGVLDNSPEDENPSCAVDDIQSCVETGTLNLAAGEYVIDAMEWTNADSLPEDFEPIGRACFDVEVTSP